MLNWRRDSGYEQRMRQLRLETEQLRLENAELDKKLRNFYALELRLKHGKSSSTTSSGLRCQPRAARASSEQTQQRRSAGPV